ncbi:LOW QUALITY PROTEIN: transcription termination factor 2 [Sceloporus undulatus]|uniref:LOW QUALITY PROTEIN: transcription termination factor 2 n=1 Tax=Sceloporus undulatus TaxID=8520 RepID=UPI001C4BB431|nr:LOW QUALITY PROTEIN: transcription termination factor 2 [Sceloporus undulatus]
MEKVLCSAHGHPCVLKTGIRDGPSKDKSFYMCGVQGQQPCGFVLPTELCPSHCLVHEQYIVDLQVLMKEQEKDAYRLFYRCIKAKLEGKRWCGSVPWQDSKCKTVPIKPPSQQMVELIYDHRNQRNPFKVPNKNHEPSSVKEMNDRGDKNSIKNEHEKKEVVEFGEKACQKLSPESNRKELPTDVKIKNSQFGEKSGNSCRRDIENQTKSSESVTGMEKAISLKGHKSYLSRKSEMPPGYTRHDVRSAEDNVQKEKRLEQSLPGFSSQKPSGRPMNEQQHGKGVPETCKDKSITMKASGSCEAEEKIVMPSDLVTVQQLPGFIAGAHCKGNSERSSVLLQKGIILAEKNCTSKNVNSSKCDIFVPSKLPVLQGFDLQQGKDGNQTNSSSVLPEQNSLQKAENVDSKVLHQQLSAELKQKKKTLKLVNVQALPDKGERLLKQVEELESALSSLKLEAEESVKSGEVNHIQQEETEPNPIEPQNTVMRGGPEPFQKQHAVNSLELHLPLGSSHHCSNTTEDSHMQALYGGQMTEERLQAVYNATSDAINQLHKSLESCPTEKEVVEDPFGLRVSLLLHQKQALGWLLWRENQKPCGGILADDMGLGKTLTMIALVLAQKSKQREEEKVKEKKLELWMSRQDSCVINSHSTLIVCPASLIHHWKNEIERHVRSGNLKVCLYHGPNRIKNTTSLSQYDIVVTTYSILAKEIPAQKEEAQTAAEDLKVEDKSFPFSPLPWIHWARIILDEAHNIKNPKVQASMAACKLRATARWAITGTPIQNNLLDMYSLLRFLRCFPFDEFKVWKNQVDNNTRKGGERLAILTRSLLLRRTKDQLDSSGKPLVLLPQRLTRLHRLKLSKDEQSVYDVLFARSRSTLQSYLRRQDTKSAGSSEGNPFDKGLPQFRLNQQDSLGKTCKDNPPISTTIHILSLLLRLRQCCCHLSLLKVALDQANLTSEGISLTLEEQLNALTLSEPDSSDPHSMVYLLGAAFSVDLFESIRQSTKLSHLLQELKSIQAHSQKSVIVSQWTSMLKVVAVHLEKFGLKYATVDGSVNPKQRMDVVEEFNNNPKGPEVMLISLLAGGVGLNLVGGNHLFLLDMHWNPALEDQACDRIYRVGQKNDVTIHRFICEGTVEEKISELQAKKRELAQKVLSGKGDAFTKLTLADLRLLFGI